ncbi:relaxase/mobilization nuclease domain-containing protein [Segatella baroniae]|uniref:relaxase/mobilization nuclease domain-containing protein n=1 Tax=Segatella baroniae TaxID=305719 RepID=UPI00040F52C9|nr:relaxase/mobilization nuclease domain-containing protein [Segatella baroniae]
MHAFTDCSSLTSATIGNNMTSIGRLSFKGCLDYITGKYNEDKHTKILAHSYGIPDMDNKAIAQVFEAYARKGGHDIEKPVGHFAYSFHKDDSGRMNDTFMEQIVMEHMQMLGIRNTEFIIGRHYDTDHDHCHLMFSMVDNDGNVIDDSMIFARNLRICKYLTKKYGLTMSSEKDKVNRDKLRGKAKLKYEFYDRVMRCKEQSSNWEEFDKALKADGLKLHFHYNNVSGNLMGVVFSDGKHSFGGKQLDEKLKLDSLIKDFGDLKHITHDSVHIKNNDVVMDAIRSRWKEWLQDVLPQVVRQANVSKPTGEMVYQDGADRCYKVPEPEIVGSPAPPPEPEKKPSR